MNIPVFYDNINIGQSTTNANAMNIDESCLAEYFREYLLQKAMSVVKWNLPEEWDESFFMDTLYRYGYLAIINTDKYGVIPMNCSLGGYNIFYRPSYAIIANPLLPSYPDQIIDKDCVIFKLQPNYQSIMDLVNIYASQMAVAVSSANINMLNSRMAYAFGAEDKNSAESFKKAADQAMSGKPFVVVDKKMFGDKKNGKPLAVPFFTQNVGQNFIAPEIMDVLKTLENEFATAVGLPNANTDKKERMIVGEVNANNVETCTRIDMWMDSWQKSCNKVKKMFNVDISFEWRVKPDELEGDDDDVFETVNNGSV